MANAEPPPAHGDSLDRGGETRMNALTEGSGRSYFLARVAVMGTEPDQAQGETAPAHAVVSEQSAHRVRAGRGRRGGQSYPDQVKTQLLLTR